jgi:hypothetical protein
MKRQQGGDSKNDHTTAMHVNDDRENETFKISASSMRGRIQRPTCMWERIAARDGGAPGVSTRALCDVPAQAHVQGFWFQVQSWGRRRKIWFGRSPILTYSRLFPHNPG